ncbi:Cnot10 [Symbiodinium natans]|uniref:Cnot10 protein n=1 Tax=Symbiodinium natans TaxID=878477 RepID=A0A812PWR1_9DINO|nr:Cnot10 [Symbiodinium natans]
MSATNSAGDAFEAYTKGEFGTCGEYLEQIHNLKTAADVKVTHNILINDYFKAGCADPHNLLTLLTQAYERAREKEKKDKGKRKKEEDEEDGIREDDDLYVLRYNQALLCVQLRHYAQARQILEELFENIEPIDDFLAIKICFLLLEVVLLQKEPEQALQILNFLEKPNAFHSLLKPERKNLEAPACIEDEEVVEGETREEEEPAEAVAAAADAQQPEKPEGPLPSLVFGACLQRHGRAPDAISPIEFKFTCLTYKIRVHILCRSMKSAKKECKNAMEILEHDLAHVPLFWKEPQNHEARSLLHNHDWAKVTCLKAYLEYAKQNHRKAFRLLTLCRFNFAPPKPGDKSGAHKSGDDEVEDHMPTDFHPAQDDACSPLFYNNMGCIHFMMHKPNLAIYYFNKDWPHSFPQSP